MEGFAAVDGGGGVAGAVAVRANGACVSRAKRVLIAIARLYYSPVEASRGLLWIIELS